MPSRSVQKRAQKFARASGRAGRPTAEQVERTFGLQPGESYEYDDIAEEETAVKIEGFTVHLIEDQISGRVRAWVKGAGDIAFGDSRTEAQSRAADALSDPLLRDRIRAWLRDPKNQPVRR